MINPQNINMVSHVITVSIILTVLLEVWETTRPMKARGKGFLLLLGDVHLFGAVPWIIYVFIDQNTSVANIVLPIAFGVLLAVPLILSTSFIFTEKEKIKFQPNPFLYLFLLCIPFLRKYIGFTWFFNNHPIFIKHTHIPNVELMIVMYVTVIVVNIYVWRLVSYLKFKKAKQEFLSQHLS